jgi:hypothetical protein
MIVSQLQSENDTRQNDGWIDGRNDVLGHQFSIRRATNEEEQL